MTRVAMWLLLGVVASAAAVLSFSALRDLAALCGFSTGLAWLLPVVVDAGAAAGCLVWLGSASEYIYPRRFARVLTCVLLASSVAGNAVVHGLSAYQLRPAWWLVVAVSAVAPAVLGAVVHLAVLTAQRRTGGPELPVDSFEGAPQGVDLPDPWANAPYADTAHRAAELIDAGVGRRRLASELGVTEYQARQILAERGGVTR